jgi:hypothetical protein
MYEFADASRDGSDRKLKGDVCFDIDFRAGPESSNDLNSPGSKRQAPDGAPDADDSLGSA